MTSAPDGPKISKVLTIVEGLMAIPVKSAPQIQHDNWFFLNASVVMAIVTAAGFSLQLAMGRSTFASPLRVHLHAVIFFGWVVLYVTQNILATRGPLTWHRQLGWIGAGWSVAMVVFGFLVIVAMVRNGTVPFFYAPLEFLIYDALCVLAFAGLTAAAIVNRRRTDWHRRLHFCGMSILLSPAFGRLLPMPLLPPFASEWTIAAISLFPIAGMVADMRRDGRVHPAWYWGIGTIASLLLLTVALTYGPLGPPIYRAVTAGSPGAAIKPLGYPPPPTGNLTTGR